MFYLNKKAIKEDLPVSRYDVRKFTEFSENTYIIETSYFYKELIKLPLSGITKVRGEQNKPWLISYRIYKTEEMWDILAEYNQLISIFQFTEGLELKYPSLSDVEQLYFSINSKEFRNRTT